MKKKILLFLILLFSFNNVYADNISTVCSSTAIEPFTKVISLIVNLIKIAVPIILIILGMIDMFRAVASQKEDEIKKGQKILISRLVSGAIVFFVVAIVQLLVGIITTNSGDSGIWDCVCKFVGCEVNNVNNGGNG